MTPIEYTDTNTPQCDLVMAFIRATPLHALFSEGRPLRVLELGCGYGPFGRRLLAAYPNVQVTGVDELPDRIESLRITLMEQRLSDRYETLTGNVNDRKLFAPSSFDAVLAISVLHHIERLQLSPVPDNLACWLKPGGQLLIADPNGANPVQWVSNHIMRMVVRFTPWLHRHKWPGETMYTPAYYRRVFGKLGFTTTHSEVVGPFGPVRGLDSLLVVARNVINNLVALITWGEWHGAGQMQLLKRKP